MLNTLNLCSESGKRTNKMNKKTIILTLTEIGLKRFHTIPTFKNMLHTSQIASLVIGNNTIVVNHYIYSKLLLMQDKNIQIN